MRLIAAAMHERCALEPKRAVFAAPAAIVLAALATLAAPAAHAAAPTAKITYAAGKKLYLDAGSDDGVAVGAELSTAKRRGKTCTIVEVSAHHAVCDVGKRSPGVGDRLLLPKIAPAATAAPAGKEPVKLAQAELASAQELLDARKKIDGATVDKVAFKKPRRALRPEWSTRGSVTLRTQAWATSTSDPFVQPAVDAAVHVGLGIISGAYAETALRVTGDVLAPPTQRFRPGEVQLYVWDAAVGVGDGPAGSGFVGAAGRFRPRKAPGMEILDGAQAGVTAFGDSLEVGGYAGAIPDLVTLAPSIDRLTAGAYFALDLAASKDVLILPRARVGFVSTPDAKSVRAIAEAEAQLLWDGLVATGVSARVGAGGTDDPLPTLDAARVDVDLHPSSSLVAHAGYRYLAPLAVDFDAATLAALGDGAVHDVSGAHHADAGARYALSDWLALGATTGGAYDTATRFGRAWVGPVVGLPHAFGGLGGLDLEYDEEASADAKALGWSGRSVSLTANLSPLDELHVITRAAYYEDFAAEVDSVREAALYALVDAPVLSWLTLRGRAQLATAFEPIDGTRRKAPSTLVADVGVTVSW